MRQLASIQRINNIKPHPNADRMEIATILGWEVCIRKDEFKVGDLCVYCEVDSIMPERSEFEFLRNDKFRIKAKRLRGVVSMGIAFPIPILSNGLLGLGIDNTNGFVDTYFEYTPLDHFEIGSDVTDLLGITKYDPPEVSSGQGNSAGSFPSYVPRTDESRIQGAMGCLDELNGHPFYITSKLDGTSETIIWHNNELSVCSRNHAVKIDPPNLYWDVVKKHNLFDKFVSYFDQHSIAIQGEIVGCGIQENRLGLKDKDFFVFNIYDINQARYLSYNEICIHCKGLGLNMVPIVEEGDSFDYTLDHLIEIANNGRYPNGHRQEGIVVRPQSEMFSNRLHGRLSFKVISPLYLLGE